MIRGHSRAFAAALSLFLCVAPFSASAQIIISEFVYDAPGADNNQEWIELFNGGSDAVDLTKWKVSDGSNHVLNAPPKNGGQGGISLAAGAYAVLADDASAFLTTHPGFSGTVIDTTLSLPNASGTLALLDDSGSIVSSVTYTKDMGAAGDGSSLQRIGGSFVAATPTPGAENAASAAPVPVPESPAHTDAPASAERVSSAVPLHVPAFVVDAGSDRTAMAGADVLFEGVARTKKGEAMTPGRYLWTFGDGATAEGRSVMHHFAEPGRYAVVLDVADGIDAVSEQIIVTVIPPSIGVSVRDTSIVLTNTAGTDLDISFWGLRAGSSTFMLPKHTILLARMAVPFPYEITRLPRVSDVTLFYPNGVAAVRAGSSTPAVSTGETEAPDPAPMAYRWSAQPAAEVSREANRPAAADATGADAPDVPAASSSIPAQAAAAGAAGASWPWWLSVVGLAGLAGVGIVTARRQRAGEWDIIDDTPQNS